MPEFVDLVRRERSRLDIVAAYGLPDEAPYPFVGSGVMREECPQCPDDGTARRESLVCSQRGIQPAEKTTAAFLPVSGMITGIDIFVRTS